MKKKSKVTKSSFSNDFTAWVAEYRMLDQSAQATALGSLIGAMLEDVNPNPVVVMMVANDLMTNGLMNMHALTSLDKLTDKLENLASKLIVTGPHKKKPPQPQLIEGKVTLTAEEMKQVQRVAHNTWQQIGDDAERARGRKLGKNSIIAVVMDADHMAHVEGMREENWPEVYSKFKRLPYTAQMKLVRQGIFGE